MKKISGLLIVLLTISLAACGGGGGSKEVRVVNYTPDLIRFDIVDSYGVDTANSSAPLYINPSRNFGLFDVDWQVNSLEDYKVNIRINDSAGIVNSLPVYSEICGQGRACDQSGAVICEYTSDYLLSCKNSPPEDIIELFPDGAPQSLYLILEVCDLNSSYCAYDYYPVLME